jgi:dihydroorotate dehydrogenase
MNRNNLLSTENLGVYRAALETFQGEGLKTLSEIALAGLSRHSLGERLIEAYAFDGGNRIVDDRLQTTVAGIDFESPILFGAGWDKKGRALNGLYALGFAGGDVGTVLPFGQSGNPKPRLWTVNHDHSVGLNCLGFNSPGEEVVKGYLEKTVSGRFPVGVNVGKNKILPNELAPWAHAEVVRTLGEYASYLVLGISSPNTANLRGLQDRGPLRENIQATQKANMSLSYPRPLFIKIDAERSPQELDDMIEVGLTEHIAGFIACNTYMGGDLKAAYGERWANQAGGLSGADPRYRALTTSVVRHIYEAAGDKLAVIGAGGVDSAETALDKIRAGASAVQIVTAIRPSKGKVAAKINHDLIERLYTENIATIQSLIGIDTTRGVQS